MARDSACAGALVARGGRGVATGWGQNVKTGSGDFTEGVGFLTYNVYNDVKGLQCCYLVLKRSFGTQMYVT